MLTVALILLAVIFFPVLAVILWVVAFVRLLNGPYNRFDKLAWLVAMIVFPILGSLVFLIFRDRQERTYARSAPATFGGV